MIEFYSSHMLARHVSDLTGTSSGAFLQAVCADFGMCSYGASSSTRPAVNGWTCRVVRVLPHTISAHTACTKRS